MVQIWRNWNVIQVGMDPQNLCLHPAPPHISWTPSCRSLWTEIYKTKTSMEKHSFAKRWRQNCAVATQVLLLLYRCGSVVTHIQRKQNLKHKPAILIWTKSALNPSEGKAIFFLIFHDKEFVLIYYHLRSIKEKSVQHGPELNSEVCCEFTTDW